MKINQILVILQLAATIQQARLMGKTNLVNVPTKPDLSILSCTSLQGVGPRLAERLAHLGIHCIQDILFHLPFRYQDRTRILPLRQLTVGEHVAIEATIDNVTTPVGGRTRLLCRIRDASGHASLRFFYINPIQRKTLVVGMKLRCFGEVRFGTAGLEMIHPEYHLVTDGLQLPEEDHLTPIYGTTEGLSQQTWRKITTQALQLLDFGGLVQELLPTQLLARLGFPSLKEALHFAHRPPKEADVALLLAGKHVAQQRLVFEELLAHRLSLMHVKHSFRSQPAIAMLAPGNLTKQFLSALPFQLTQAQQRVVTDIQQDLSMPHPMLRLVQGDVGSGKTVVAALAMLQVVENGYQAAFLAPTEILVEQHFQTFKKWFAAVNIRVVLLSGSMKVADKRESIEAIATHQAQIVLGTHAIFQKQISFSKLALIVVDEQHRFGVEQRAMLREKGMHENNCPHQLIMTATPIPRTLAMSVYADLDYSVIDELPPGRTPVLTTVMSNARRDEILEHIRTACAEGRQAYWVCTLIEESDVLQCQAAEETVEKLRVALAPLKIGLVHGRMKPNDKEQVMQLFKAGEIHLLVATTVIEVGVDVPNASLMIIENAERLGLAQLHQLRGRVGRGSVASYCVLLYQSPISMIAKQRLGIMRATTDGFKIAQHDLELRGPGEVLGTRQTGDIALRIADLLRDSDLLPKVQEASAVMLKEHPQHIDVLIKRWLGKSEQYRQV